MIYLDNASTTQVDPEVLEAMLPYLKEQYGNPGTLYKLGRDAKAAVENARCQVADFVGAEPNQIIFTSGGTEANNMVFFSMAEYLKSIGKKHIIISAVEHDSVIKSVKEMCIKHGFYYDTVGVDEYGCVDPDDIKNMIKEDTGIVSVMYMNNETGSINNVYAISKICRASGVFFHTDCVQAASSIDINANEKIGCDFLTISSHKIHGVKGVGAMYARNPGLLSSMICGGATQEFGLRGGTENVASIVAFGKACEIMKENLLFNQIHLLDIREEFYKQLEKSLTKYGIANSLHINGSRNVFGKILNIRFDGIDSETLLLLLDTAGICVSAGSACRSHESNPSHVLLAMGLSSDEARSAIRVSFSKYTKKEEVVFAAKKIADCVDALRY